MPLFPFILLGLGVVGIFLVVRWVTQVRTLASSPSLPTGFVTDVSVLKQEYTRYYGSTVDESRVGSRFQSASELAGRHNFPGAISMLEGVTKNGAVPVLYHDLGVAYTQLSDYERAADAFREALAREPEYPATRKFLRDAKGFAPGAVEPYSTEGEPNDDSRRANLIALRSPVGGEVGSANDTIDYFRVISPPAPRDQITIELANRSIKFSPRVHVYDANLKLLTWGEKEARPGESIKFTGGPQPNTTLFIVVSSADNDSGQYLLTVTPEKAFDHYEPNDDILSSRRISIGEEVSANVMDSQDTDFYFFVSPRKGSVTIQLRNRSTDLIPSVTTYNNDRRNLGFAQDVTKPGSSVQHTVNVEKDLTYYVQVSAQGGTSGAYTLRVD